MVHYRDPETGVLDAEEREEMTRHTTRGLQMVDAIARNFGLEHLEGLDILRHIAESHHERLDGSGYPRGLSDGAIPLEARIVAAAEIQRRFQDAPPAP
jgi:HD-GYP domain-containing protein (c-di-GMP phosphodiesterase class II)